MENKNTTETVKELKALGFWHDYDSEVEEKGTPDEFSYSVYKLQINEHLLDATVEYGRKKQLRGVFFYLNDKELSGRLITQDDINLLKEIL